MYEGIEQEEVEGFCQPYLGAACSKFVGNKSIYVTSKIQQGATEEKLMGTLTIKINYQ